MYGSAAAWRRRWYAQHPERVRRLTRPVISVGNLSIGGSGKTPVVEYLARLLIESGERPAVLTRGYARRVAEAGVTVVSDGGHILADVNHAGDEPLMLARSLPGASVLVAADRYLAGRVAESRLGATVHLLDDGFQHYGLARDLDLLLVCEDDLSDHPLPAGRLREPIAGGATADAALVTAGYATAAERIGRALRVETVFLVTRALGPPRQIADGEPVVVPSESRVFAVAAIARPEQFFADLASVGWDVVGTMPFPDHYPFTERDVKRIGRAARSAAAAIVLTTEKDAVRLDLHDLTGLPIASVPLKAMVDPEGDFREWLLARLGASHPAPGTEHPAPRTQHSAPLQD